MSYPRHHTIDHYLKKVRLHTEPYTADILGKEIIIFPGVMSPKYDRSAQMMISMMPSQHEKRVLDMGCGTGILSLFSFFQGARSITAVDINPAAVENTRKNFEKHSVSRCSVIVSDLFENVRGVFDTIVFNAPFHGNQPQDTLELGTSDLNYTTLQRFMAEVSKYLNANGTVIIGFADTGDNVLLKSLIEKNDFKIDTFQEYPNGDWSMFLYTLKKLK